MNREIYKAITEFQDRTFTDATALSCAKHLKEEVLELLEGIEQGKVDESEIADCIMLLFGIANKAGIGYDGIIKALGAKHFINLGRNWVKTDKGYHKHDSTINS